MNTSELREALRKAKRRREKADTEMTELVAAIQQMDADIAALGEAVKAADEQDALAPVVDRYANEPAPPVS